MNSARSCELLVPLPSRSQVNLGTRGRAHTTQDRAVTTPARAGPCQGRRRRNHQDQSPRSSLPVMFVSCSAMGMQADDVLP